MCSYYFSTVSVAEWPPFGKKLLARLTVNPLCESEGSGELLTIYNNFPRTIRIDLATFTNYTYVISVLIGFAIFLWHFLDLPYN